MLFDKKDEVRHENTKHPVFYGFISPSSSYASLSELDIVSCSSPKSFSSASSSRETSPSPSSPLSLAIEYAKHTTKRKSSLCNMTSGSSFFEITDNCNIVKVPSNTTDASLSCQKTTNHKIPCFSERPDHIRVDLLIEAGFIFVNILECSSPKSIPKRKSRSEYLSGRRQLRLYDASSCWCNTVTGPFYQAIHIMLKFIISLRAQWLLDYADDVYWAVLNLRKWTLHIWRTADVQ